MKKPYIFCHMMVSLDGKIVGKYMSTKASQGTGALFYDLAFGSNPYYHHQGWLSGRTTTDDNFTFYKEPKLELNAPTVPAGDFVVKSTTEKYYISIDGSGKLGWESNLLSYQETKAQVLEVLTAKASNDYKAFLRKKNIAYVIAGKDSLDLELLLDKLVTLFGMETVMLGGGGVLNWSFLQAGLCDEVSVVVAPVADGASDTPTLFDTKEGLTQDSPIEFELKQVKSYPDSSIWLNYLVKNN